MSERFDTVSVRGDGKALPKMHVSSAFRSRWEGARGELFPKLAADFPRFSAALMRFGEPKLLLFKWSFNSPAVFVGYASAGCDIVVTLSSLERSDWDDFSYHRPYSFAPEGLGALFDCFEVFEFVGADGYPLETGREVGVSPLPIHVPFAQDLPRWASARNVPRKSVLDKVRSLGLESPKVWLETRFGEALVVDIAKANPLYFASVGPGGMTIDPVADARALVDSYLGRVVSDPFGMHGLQDG